MTRHNLDSHISWLLSRKVAPPSGAHARFTTSTTTVEPANASPVETEAEEDIQRILPSPPRPQRVVQPVHVAPAFARPALPPSVAARTYLQAPVQALTDESMGITSAKKSTRPGLMSQHQLATPASTTSSAATSSSLTKNYTSFLKDKTDHGGFSHSPEDTFYRSEELRTCRYPFLETAIEKGPSAECPERSFSNATNAQTNSPRTISIQARDNRFCGSDG